MPKHNSPGGNNKTNCLLCRADILAGYEALLDHLRDDHVAIAANLTPPGIPSPISASPSSVNTTLDELNVVHVNLTPPRIPSLRSASPSSVNTTLDELNEVHVPIDGYFDGDAADDVLTAATPDHESSTSSAYLTPPRIQSPRSASPSSVNDVLMASTPDHESSTAARAAAIASAIASASSAAVATSSPSQKTPKSTSEKRMRPTRAGARQSKGRYTEFKESSSEESMEETSEDEYDEKKGKE